MADTDLDTLLAKVAATPRRRVPKQAEVGTERYEFLSRLGRGGFGDVFEARDRQHGTIVALKRLSRPEPGWLYRFKREFRVVADLSHPNIVRLYELFCEGEDWYLTMERVRGRPFAEHVERAPEDLRSCFAQLAQAIAALHRARCLHRDIKPSNVLVESTGRVVLLDFGLARLGGKIMATAIAGTPPFMAPEIVTGHDPSEASDWYAFGVMLFHSLTGRLPFDGTRSGMFQLKLDGPPTVVGATGDFSEPQLEQLALALLSPVAADRPSGEQIVGLLADTAPSVRPGPARDDTVLVGREAELAALGEAFARSQQQTVLATVHGAPGIGKSSLIREFADIETANGARCYAGRCRESESLPFKGLDGVIDMLCDDLLSRTNDDVAALVPPQAHALVQMFPVLKRVSELARLEPGDDELTTPHASRRSARATLREIIRRLAQRQPVILFVDDLQWANEDSASMLLDLLAPPAPPILVVAAYRRDSHGAGGLLDKFIMSALSRGNVDRVDVAVDALDEAGVRALLAAHAGGPLDARVALAQTGGHPDLLSRLVASPTHTPSGADLASVIRAQIETLAPVARRVLEVVSLSVSALSQRAAFAVLGIPWDAIAVDELRREKLVLATTSDLDSVVEPYHDRVRESVLATLSPDHARALHLTVASYLETRGRAEPEALVHHYRLADQSELALKWTRSAALIAREAFAFTRAAELFRDAVQLARTDEDRIDLLVELGHAQLQDGNRADAGRSFLSAAQTATEAGEDELAAAMLTRAGQHFLLAGHIKHGIALLRDSLAAVGVTLPADSATSVGATINIGAQLATRGLAFTPHQEDELSPRALRRLDLQLEVGRALALTDMRATWATSQALLEALDIGETYRVQRAMAHYVFSNCARAPNHPVIVQSVRQARDLAEELDDDRSRAWALLASGMWKAQRAEFVEAVDELRSARRLFLVDGREHAREAAIANIASLVLLGNYGVDLPRAYREYERAIEEALERDDLFSANWGRVLFTWMALSKGDVANARQSLALARRGWPAANEELFAALALVNEIAIELYAEPHTAWAVVERLRSDFETLYASLIAVTRGIFHRLAASSALAAYAAGTVSAAATVERLAHCLDRVQDWEYGGPMIHAIEAMLAIARGDRPGYEARLSIAEDGWRRQTQHGPMLVAQLRLHQSRGETAAEVARADELRAFGVADPDRYGLLFAGPAMRPVAPAHSPD